MLKRRAKRRYLSIVHADDATDIIKAIKKRYSELFGSIATEKAAMTLIKSENNVTIIKCKLDQLENILVVIALTDPPVMTLDMSGSMKQLRRRLAKI